MRLKVFLCLAVFLFAASIQAQDLKIHVNEKGLVGFADQNGNVVIKCQYESALPFVDGGAIVSKSGKSGIIDTSGNILLPLNYTQIQTWNDNLYLIKSGKKMGLADHQGKIILPVVYSHISSANCYGKALIAQGGKSTPIPNEKKNYMFFAKYGIIDSNGNVLIPAKYRGLYEFSFDGTNVFPYNEGKRLKYSYHSTIDTLETDCSLLGFSSSGLNIYNAGIMDGSGKELLKPGLYYCVMEPQNGMVRYYNVKKKQTLCGYHNLNTGENFQATSFDQQPIIDEIKFWSHGDFIGDIAPVNGTSWSFVNKSGNTLRSGYSSIKHSQTAGLWAAKNSSGTYDVFDEKNNDIPELSGYRDIYFPEHKEDKTIFSVQKDDKFGCVSRSGETVIPFEYEMALGNCYDMVAIKQNGKWGMLTANNDSLVPIEFADLMLPSERSAKHIWVMKSDSLYYHLNLISNQLASDGYKYVSNFENGIALVVPLDLKITDTQINRAQMFEPNTKKETIDAFDMSESVGAFGYLLNTEDKKLIDLPVSTMYKDAVIKEIKKLGVKTPTESEQKKILLDVTRENRSYDLKSTISEDEWNY